MIERKAAYYAERKLKAAREAKGLSQQELAAKLNVVCQIVSKWERGLSMPDADLLIALSEATETPIGAQLRETVLTAKLEIVNLQFVRQNETRRKTLHGVLVAICATTMLALACFAALDGSYLGWNLNNPETAIAVTLLHAFEWVLVRAAPFVLAVAAIGLLLARKASRSN